MEHGSGGDEEWICRRCCLLAWPWPPLIWKDREIMRGRVSIPLAPNELEEAWRPGGGQCHICLGGLVSLQPIGMGWFASISFCLVVLFGLVIKSKPKSNTKLW